MEFDEIGLIGDHPVDFLASAIQGRCRFESGARSSCPWPNVDDAHKQTQEQKQEQLILVDHRRSL